MRQRLQCGGELVTAFRPSGWSIPGDGNPLKPIDPVEMRHVSAILYRGATSCRQTGPAKSCRADVAGAEPFFWVRLYTNAGITDRQEGDYRMTEVPQRSTTQTPIEALMRGPASRFSQSGNTQAANRMANKLRKKRAHKRNLRRSHANG